MKHLVALLVTLALIFGLCAAAEADSPALTNAQSSQYNAFLRRLEGATLRVNADAKNTTSMSVNGRTWLVLTPSDYGQYVLEYHGDEHIYTYVILDTSLKARNGKDIYQLALIMSLSDETTEIMEFFHTLSTRVEKEYEGYAYQLFEESPISKDKAVVLRARSLSVTAPSAVEPTPEPSSDAGGASSSDSGAEYPPGIYKVGASIPAGKYVLVAQRGKEGHFVVSTDSLGKKIVNHGKFSTSKNVIIKEGEYLKLTSCLAMPSGDALESFESDAGSADPTTGTGQLGLAVDQDTWGGFGDFLDFSNILAGVCVLKYKIAPSYSNNATIQQNYHTVERFIRNGPGDQFDEIQYWAVAEMADGSESKVISFTVSKGLIEKIAAREVPALTMGDHVDDLWVLPSLLK